MVDPELFDDPGPLEPQPPGRARRIATVAILVVLIVSMVFLAFVSGRGLVTVDPVGTDRPAPSTPSATGTDGPTVAARGTLAVVDANGRLTTTEPGGPAVPLGAAGIAYSFPTWSPDGDRIAALGEDGAASVLQILAWPTTSAGDASRTIYDSADRPPFYISWSTDGSLVSFLTTEPDGIALQLAPADGSAPAAVLRCGAPMYWVWTDEGVLVHSGGETPDAFIGELRFDGVSIEPSALSPGGFRAPAISPDGAIRAYVVPGDTTSDRVVIERRDGSGRQQVDVHGAAALGIDPSGTALAFIAPDAPGREISLPVGPLRVMDATTGKVRVLLDGSVVAFFWSPDGRTIAALDIAGVPSDPVARAGRTATAVLARTRPTVAAPGLGLRLVFVDPATGTVTGQRPVQVGDVFADHVLPFFDQYAVSHRFWSPDGRAVALPVVDADGAASIAVIPADGSAATRIDGGVAAAWSP